MAAVQSATDRSSKDSSWGQTSKHAEAFKAELEQAKGDAVRAPQPPMPGVLTSMFQGVWHGGADLAQTGQVIAGGTAQTEVPSSPASKPLEWGDLAHPWGQFLPKIAYRLGESWPTLAGGLAGTTLGVAAVGGPENPVSILTGLGGGVLGAGAMNGLQTFGGYFTEELNKTPADADGAYDRALNRAFVSGVFTGATWAAMPIRVFQGPLKNLVFQAFGLQPSIAMAHRAADNILTGTPVTDGMSDSVTQAVLMTAPIVGAQQLGRVIAPKWGGAPGGAPPAQPRTVQRPDPAENPAAPVVAESGTSMALLASEAVINEIRTNRFGPGSGFTGVYNIGTGDLMLRPSGQTTYVDGAAPAGRVLRNGGHLEVAEEMFLNSNKFPRSDLDIGFSFVIRDDGILEMNWLSRSINGRNFGNPQGPDWIRPYIERFLGEMTERDVISN